MRAWIGLSLLLSAVAGGINLVGAARRTPPPPRIPAAAPVGNVLSQERRLAPLRAALQRRDVRGTVAYMSGLPPAAMRRDPAAMERYFLSQFAVVPWILDADAARSEWAVANLPPAGPAEPLPSGYAVVEDCGDGVLLLRRTGP